MGTMTVGRGLPTLVRLQQECGAEGRELAWRLHDRLIQGTAGCEEWIGACTGAGLPTIRFHGRSQSIPRLIWETFNPGNPKPAYVHRGCRNTRCVSAAHLTTQHPRRVAPTLADIESHTRTERRCLRWSGAHGQNGYGLLRHMGMTFHVHRFVWTLQHGQPPVGMVVAHRCLNRDCVNLEHLYLATAGDRARDVTDMGRRPHGEAHWNHKLTLEKVRAIRISGLSNTQLAWQFEVSRSTIAAIRSFRSWRRDH